MSTILVTGSTGSLGSSIINYLKEKSSGETIAGLARNKEKSNSLKEMGVDVRIGNYDDPESLETAFKGVDKLIFVSASKLDKRVQQHKNVVEAAKEAGVEHVIYTSFQRENETEESPIWMVAESHLKTEEWLKESGMKYTFLRNNLYMDFIPMFLGDNVLEQGNVYLPAGDGVMACALRNDMAEATVNVALGEGHENTAYRFGNSQSWSFNDVADTLSKISGKEIGYISPTVDEFMNTMQDAGVPEEAIGMSVGFAQAIDQGELAATSSDFESILGRKPISLPDFLKQVYG
jgi:NAD(P)H dehydrogenase (quinone)